LRLSRGLGACCGPHRGGQALRHSRIRPWRPSRGLRARPLEPAPARAAKINRAHSPPTQDGFRSTARKTATCKGAKSAVMSRWFTQTCDRREPPARKRGTRKGEKYPLYLILFRLPNRRQGTGQLTRLGDMSAEPDAELGYMIRWPRRLYGRR